MIILHSKSIIIDKKEIGSQNPVYIIAEAGSNHNGSIDKAKELIDIASSSGADAIKLQNFTADKMSKGVVTNYWKT